MHLNVNKSNVYVDDGCIKEEKIFYLNKRKTNIKKMFPGINVIEWLQRSVWQHHWPSLRFSFWVQFVDASRVILYEDDVFYEIFN
jgi:hypothetical protein